ncbi:MAG: hypothetical protein ACRC9K_22180 [Afipia sp.]
MIIVPAFLGAAMNGFAQFHPMSLLAGVGLGFVLASVALLFVRDKPQKMSVDALPRALKRDTPRR